ncbi:transmembrane sensor [Pedobacter africanus]|uniref:Ferric-dicitrate binding protein FerR (Iron transport regulator) n=1 Tax=Pedobacter africanus TaxID=151894 RepID=A0ACC6KW85_9SPHI|nr:FecR domain-containing protein [Pedobacter africanus]MDR6783420.1 ferric-dicitrate binding protein FerR (iron transport regulator) [Pedobacter africanus]
MTKEELSQLASKVAEGKASMAELARYNAACEAFQKEEIGWPGMEKELVKMEVASLKQFWAEQPDRGGATVKLWPRIAIAAAAVAAIVFGIWFYNSGPEILKDPGSGPGQDNVAKHDIAPGKNTATLTLPGGKTITLSDAKNGVVVGEDLRYNDNTAVISNNSAELAKGSVPGSLEMTLNTPRGGTYQITLSDGTKVWLNAASKLTYTAVAYQTGQRRVKLDGEAYFEVAKDKVHPFIIESAGQKIEVLGTHFNVNSYSDEPVTETTLLEGSVKISSSGPQKNSSLRGGERRQNVILKPNQKAVLKGEKIKIGNADTEAIVAWKNGYFKFNEESIQDVMRKLSRWYNIDVVYAHDLPQGKFTGRISRFKKISEVLALMEFGTSVKFKIEGRRVTVIGEK